jgi:purine-nucleoside phosphorylase
MNPSTDFDYAQAAQTADFLSSIIRDLPEVAILTGTGLGQATAAAHVDHVVHYTDIPNFPSPTVESHDGRLLAGRMSGKTIFVFQGRFHLYEGYSPQAVTFPVRVLQALGVRTLILTNAAGGLNSRFAAGDIMLIRDHINLTGENPLAGPNDSRWGPRFPDMSKAHNGLLQEIARRGAPGGETTLQAGVYAGLKGPSLETPAEIRFLRTIGADAVGFSTVMETIAAVHGGIRVLGLSVITNMCLPDAPIPADVKAIILTAERAAPHLGAVIAGVLEAIDG